MAWIKENYTLEENPGLGEQGLFYYYHTFAKALAALDIDKLTDKSGKARDWRSDLLEELISRQQANGSWLNTTPRWLENDPSLVTGYVLLAIGNVVE
jgi:squalene-hopene/tetraprenyl-beta-curcumene cyclase